MIIEAKNRKDFAVKLVKLADSARRTRALDARIQLALKLGSLDVHHYRSPNGTIESTFAGRRFTIPATAIGPHKVTVICDVQSYRVIRSHGIERILRGAIGDGQSRLLIREILIDEALLRALRRGRFISSRPGDLIDEMVDEETAKKFKVVPNWLWGEKKDESAPVFLFPFIPNESGVIQICNEVPTPYITNIFDTVLIASVLFGGYRVPLGQGMVIPMDLSRWKATMHCVPRESMKPYDDMTVEEFMYNVDQGFQYKASASMVSDLNEALYRWQGRTDQMKRIFSALCGTRFPEGSWGTVMRMINDALELFEETPDEIILKSWFDPPRALTLRALRHIMSKMSDHGLVSLALKTEGIKVLDEQRFEVPSLEPYIVAEQAKRYHNDPRLDLTLRDLVNNLDGKNRQHLIRLVLEAERNE